MISVSHESDGEAHALRRYVSARAQGRTAPEFSRHDSALGGWVAAERAEAAGLCDGKRFRQVRRPGLPWCLWLGLDTHIAEDHALQAFFELHATDPHDWQGLFKEVTRNRRRALREWRRKGRESISRVRWDQAHGNGTEAEAVRLPSPLAEEFRMPGRGMRSLKTG